MIMNKFVYWTPRILAILFIAFLTIFSLDMISSELSIWQIVAGLAMQNIPVIILIAVLIISWKREIVGSVAFFGGGVLYILLMILQSGAEWYIALIWSMILASPSFLIGILFLIGWQRKRKNEPIPPGA